MTELNEVVEGNPENHMLKCSENSESGTNTINEISSDLNTQLTESLLSDEEGSTDNENRNASSEISSDNKEQEYSDTNDSASDKSSISDSQNNLVYLHSINVLRENCLKLNDDNKALEARLELVLKQRDNAIKAKETMVMRYAVSEKSVLDVKSVKEQAEKKNKEVIKENEILQHKVTVMSSEKSRICQMLDNKCYELKSSQQEVERLKYDLNTLETKIKWLQSNFKSEMDSRKECEIKLDAVSSKLQEAAEQMENVKRDAEESIRAFHQSQDNRAHVLEQQFKEQQANLILLRHEREDRENQVKGLQGELGRLQMKQRETLQENNTLSLKIQHLERERLDFGQKLSELRTSADQHRQDSADLVTKTAQLEQLKLQLKNEQDQLTASNDQISLFKNRNVELESDMVSCREREAELLLFTQQLTDKNVGLQSEFTAMETKVQQLTCEQTLLRRATKEQETKVNILATQLAEERTKRLEEVGELGKNLGDKASACDALSHEIADQRGENCVMKRKYELSLKELNKELQQCRKKIEHYETASTSSASSNSSLNAMDQPVSSGSPVHPLAMMEQVKVIQPEATVDKQTLIEHIVKLQRISARKSEKIDFLEEHVNTLVAELQRKTRLLQGYIMREQSGTLTSNKMDSNKAHIAKLHGVMASVYGSRVADENLTLELSLDINRKLQAILEDALLKNITLKENVDTLGAEIDRLSNLLKPSSTT